MESTQYEYLILKVYIMYFKLKKEFISQLLAIKIKNILLVVVTDSCKYELVV